MYFSSTVEEKEKVRTGRMPEPKAATRPSWTRGIVTAGNENVAGGAIKPEEELKREVERDRRDQERWHGMVEAREEKNKG